MYVHLKLIGRPPLIPGAKPIYMILSQHSSVGKMNQNLYLRRVSRRNNKFNDQENIIFGKSGYKTVSGQSINEANVRSCKLRASDVYKLLVKYFFPIMALNEIEYMQYERATNIRSQRNLSFQLREP